MMATPSHNECDVCDARVQEKSRLHIVLDRKMDPAGSMTDQVALLDLCEEHLSKAMSHLLETDRLTSYELGRWLVIWVKQQKAAEAEAA